MSRLDTAYDYSIDSDWGGDPQYRGCCVDMACQTRVASRPERNQISTAAVEETNESKSSGLGYLHKTFLPLRMYLPSYCLVTGRFYSSLVTLGMPTIQTWRVKKEIIIYVGLRDTAELISLSAGEGYRRYKQYDTPGSLRCHLSHPIFSPQVWLRRRARWIWWIWPWRSVW
jgi:hypothetical protein